MYLCIWVTESLCFTLETNTILSINYSPIKKKQHHEQIVVLNRKLIYMKALSVLSDLMLVYHLAASVEKLDQSYYDCSFLTPYPAVL